MKSVPPPFDPIADSKSRARQLARVSIASPFAAILLLLISNQLTRGQISPGWIDTIFSTASTIIVLGGLVSGVAGYIGGRERGSRDTMLIALLGLLVGGAYVALAAQAIWYWWQLPGN